MYHERLTITIVSSPPINTRVTVTKDYHEQLTITVVSSPPINTRVTVTKDYHKQLTITVVSSPPINARVTLPSHVITQLVQTVGGAGLAAVPAVCSSVAFCVYVESYTTLYLIWLTPSVRFVYQKGHRKNTRPDL